MRVRLPLEAIFRSSSMVEQSAVNRTVAGESDPKEVPPPTGFCLAGSSNPVSPTWFVSMRYMLLWRKEERKTQDRGTRQPLALFSRSACFGSSDGSSTWLKPRGSLVQLQPKAFLHDESTGVLA